MINLILNNSRNKKSTFSSLILYNLYLTHTSRVQEEFSKFQFSKKIEFSRRILYYISNFPFSLTSWKSLHSRSYETHDFWHKFDKFEKNILCSNEWERISWKFWEKSRDLHTIIYKSLIVNRKGIKSRRNSSKIEISNLECIYISGR